MPCLAEQGGQGRCHAHGVDVLALNIAYISLRFTQRTGDGAANVHTAREMFDFSRVPRGKPAGPLHDGGGGEALSPATVWREVGWQLSPALPGPHVYAENEKVEGILFPRT